jgi:hypothetical protein
MRPVQQSDKYFGFDIPSDDEEEDDTITKLAESICVGDCQVKNESESRTKCIGMAFASARSFVLLKMPINCKLSI